jgi:hypothetical protein
MLASVAAPATAQNERRANLATNGITNQGKCTIEIVVDGVADVEIRGDSASLRNISGRPPQWRRFVCSGRMPVNPADFRVTGVDGRGRIELIRDPRNGGAAVVRVEDRQGGAEGYTFDLTWSDRGGSYSGGPGSFRPYDRNGQYGDRGAWTSEQAINGCQRAVEDRVRRDGYGSRVRFDAIRVDDRPGRADWVVGSVRTGRDSFNFSCSVNLNNGTVRSVDLRRR